MKRGIKLFFLERIIGIAGLALFSFLLMNISDFVSSLDRRDRVLLAVFFVFYAFLIIVDLMKLARLMSTMPEGDLEHFLYDEGQKKFLSLSQKSRKIQKYSMIFMIMASFGGIFFSHERQKFISCFLFLGSILFFTIHVYREWKYR